MKRSEQVERVICDACETNSAFEWDACLHCGRVYCSECEKTQAVEYKHAIHFSGSGDGHYCVSCDAALRKTGDLLHSAYLKIAALRHEVDGWSANFEVRRQEAEGRLQKLLTARES